MQIPGSSHYHSQQSIFEAILEECSAKQLQVEQPEDHFNRDLPVCPELSQPESKRSAWFWLHQTPIDELQDDNQNTVDDANLEFRRVKSLRQEQESKIAQFLRVDKTKTLRVGEPEKGDSPIGKYSQSLSPKKRKKIDKGKQMKVIQQCQ